MSSILRAVGMGPFSIWKPSRGPSSLILTDFGRSAMVPPSMLSLLLQSYVRTFGAGSDRHKPLISLNNPCEIGPTEPLESRFWLQNRGANRVGARQRRRLDRQFRWENFALRQKTAPVEEGNALVPETRRGQTPLISG